MRRTRKSGETKEHVCVQSTVNVTVSTCINGNKGYVDKFMANAGITARHGKQVNISTANHERIAKFVNVVGKGQVSMTSYIENIINEHFNIYAVEIKKAFEEGLKEYKL